MLCIMVLLHMLVQQQELSVRDTDYQLDAIKHSLYSSFLVYCPKEFLAPRWPYQLLLNVTKKLKGIILHVCLLKFKTQTSNCFWSLFIF